MKLYQYETVSKTRSAWYFLVPLGDIHLGTKNCDEKKLYSIIKWIKETDNVRWIGMGDYADFINYSDPRFDPQNLSVQYLKHLDNLPTAQLSELIRLLKPIKDKCIAVLEGNHEEVIKKRYHLDVATVLAHNLEVPNLGYNGMIRWVFRRVAGNSNRYDSKRINIFATHGYGGAGGTGGKITRAENIGKGFDADIYLCGHVHEKAGIDKERLCLVGEGKTLKLVAKKRIYALTGSFLKTYEVGTSSYAERKGYQPVPTGIVKIRLEPFHQQKFNGKPFDSPVHCHISE